MVNGRNRAVPRRPRLAKRRQNRQMSGECSRPKFDKANAAGQNPAQDDHDAETFDQLCQIRRPEKGQRRPVVGRRRRSRRRGQGIRPWQCAWRAHSRSPISPAKSGSTVEVIAPQGSALDRLLVIGVGKPSNIEEYDWLKFGGADRGAVPQGRRSRGCARPAGRRDRRRRRGRPCGRHPASGPIISTNTRPRRTMPTASRPNRSRRSSPSYAPIRRPPGRPLPTPKRWRTALSLARDLVNEPANMLGPIEFAAQAKALEKLGVSGEILTEKEMGKLGMGALLGVAQGSPRGARLVVMQWNGGKAKEKPVAFVGKGVTFDTGGISIKPAAGMEDMKGDMGGAAAVTGLMHALAARKAKVNVVGIIGLVENCRRRQRAASGRHRHLDVGPDHRGAEHRRRRPSRACRCALVLQPALRAEIHGQSGDAHRRDHGGARPGPCRALLQQ